MCVEQNARDKPYVQWWFQRQEKIEKQLPAKHLEHQTTLPPVKKHVLGVDVLSVFRLLKVRAKNGVSIGAYQTS